MGFFSQIMCEARQEDEERRPFPKFTRDIEGQCTMVDHTPPADKKELEPAPALDLSDTQGSEDERRRTHEAAEAKRKAEFDAKQAAKRQAEQESLSKLDSMTDEQRSALPPIRKS